MKNYTRLLSNLRSVRKTPSRPGISDSHRADCPVCEGHNTPLSIARTDDGRVLLHCFAGCSAIDIINKTGLDFSDLMPQSRLQDSQSEKGFTSLGDWMSAAALADAVAWASTLVALDPTEQNIANLVALSNEFQKAARQAMRAGRSK